MAAGSLTDLGPGRVAVSGNAALDAGLALGDTATLGAGGHTVQVTIVAVLPGPAPRFAGFMVDASDLDRLGAPAGYSGVFADAASGGEEARTAGQRTLRTLAEGRADLGITVLADQRDEEQKMIDYVLWVVIGLMGLTVLIAVVGVGSTTALSVVERIRESGLLRAVGLSRAGLRTMLTVESSLYGAIGATLGVLLGVPYAWLAIRSIDHGAPLEAPIGQIAAVFAALVIFTAVAGVLPARRAARVSPVAALGTDD
jgi:putative ABC transport system permease protein